VSLERDALIHILHMAQDDEGGDMIPGIERRAQLALEGKTPEQDARDRHRAGIDLSGRPA
jgi:hypothetical protein